MRAEIFKKFVNELDDDTEVVFSYMTREEMEEEYNAGVPFPDRLWEVIETDIGYDYDDIAWTISIAREYYVEQLEKEKNEDSQ